MLRKNRLPSRPYVANRGMPHPIAWRVNRPRKAEEDSKMGKGTRISANRMLCIKYFNSSSQNCDLQSRDSRTSLERFHSPHKTPHAYLVRKEGVYVGSECSMLRRKLRGDDHLQRNASLLISSQHPCTERVSQSTNYQQHVRQHPSSPLSVRRLSDDRRYCPQRPLQL